MFSLLVTVLTAASLAAAQGTCSRSYKVVEGDYCDKISAAQNVSTYQLAVANYNTINEGCTNLDIDQVICLGITNQDCKSTYIVQEGDYCDLVSSKFGTNTTMLRTNNPQIDDNCYNLYVGQVLCVADTPLFTPPPEGWTLPGANLDDGSFQDVSDVTYEGATTIVSSAAAAATTVPAAAKAVNNAVTLPATTEKDEDCEEDEVAAPAAAVVAEDDDDSGSDADDDDVPDCE